MEQSAVDDLIRRKYSGKKSGDGRDWLITGWQGRNWDQCERKRGEGSYAKVHSFEGYHDRKGLCVKVLNVRDDEPETKNKIGSMEMYHNELGALVRATEASVPGVVRLVTSTAWGRSPALILRYHGTLTLDKALKDKTLERTSKKDIIGQLVQIAIDLNAIKVAHNDITPDNVMLEKKEINGVVSYCATLIDFGTATVLSEDGMSAPPVTGSDGYMDPRVTYARLSRQNKEPDNRTFDGLQSDMFSIAMLACNMNLNLEYLPIHGCIERERPEEAVDRVLFELTRKAASHVWSERWDATGAENSAFMVRWRETSQYAPGKPGRDAPTITEPVEVPNPFLPEVQQQEQHVHVPIQAGSDGGGGSGSASGQANVDRNAPGMVEAAAGQAAVVQAVDDAPPAGAGTEASLSAGEAQKRELEGRETLTDQGAPKRRNIKLGSQVGTSRSESPATADAGSPAAPVDGPKEGQVSMAPEPQQKNLGQGASADDGDGDGGGSNGSCGEGDGSGNQSHVIEATIESAAAAGQGTEGSAAAAAPAAAEGSATSPGELGKTDGAAGERNEGGSLPKGGDVECGLAVEMSMSGSPAAADTAGAAAPEYGPTEMALYMVPGVQHRDPTHGASADGGGEKSFGEDVGGENGSAGMQAAGEWTSMSGPPAAIDADAVAAAALEDGPGKRPISLGSGAQLQDLGEGGFAGGDGGGDGGGNADEWGEVQAKGGGGANESGENQAAAAAAAAVVPSWSISGRGSAAAASPWSLVGSTTAGAGAGAEAGAEAEAESELTAASPATPAGTGAGTGVATAETESVAVDRTVAARTGTATGAAAGEAAASERDEALSAAAGGFASAGGMKRRRPGEDDDEGERPQRSKRRGGGGGAGAGGHMMGATGEPAAAVPAEVPTPIPAKRSLRSTTTQQTKNSLRAKEVRERAKEEAKKGRKTRSTKIGTRKRAAGTVEQGEGQASKRSRRR